MRWGWRKKKYKKAEIHPDEILLDAQNPAEFDTDQFEGRIERPLSRRSFIAAGSIVGLIVLGLLVRTGDLQVLQGVAYAKQARENQLAQKTIFADRGSLEDRTGRPLAWNDREDITDDFAKRVYATYRGVAHTVGYVKPPAKDSAGFYYRDTFEGVDGAEKAFDSALAGHNGLTLTETDARGKVVSEAAVRPPVAGEKVVLSIDARVTEGLYDALAARAVSARAVGAAGVIIDVRTGELLALASYPEYSSAVMLSGDSEAISAYNNRHNPFLNRATDGLYAPGSIVKPMMAAAALNEGIIDEFKQILSTGQLVLPNPYNPDSPSVFKDWRVNGWTDARRAIAVSSDVYFYQIGGGFEGQQGLGIARIDEYLRKFGFGADAGLEGYSSAEGTIPTPEWKAEHFPDDPVWRVGNTYHTSIGQYGTEVTPLQAARMTAAIANGGMLLRPVIVASTTPRGSPIDIGAHTLLVAREGMRMGVREGIATAVNMPFVSVAAKTGTAQVGLRNEYQNAWMIGFWPYEKPRYAYAVVLERMPAGTQIGGSAVMSDFFYFLEANAPQYLQ